MLTESMVVEMRTGVSKPSQDVVIHPKNISSPSVPEDDAALDHVPIMEKEEVQESKKILPPKVLDSDNSPKIHTKKMQKKNAEAPAKHTGLKDQKSRGTSQKAEVLAMLQSSTSNLSESLDAELGALSIASKNMQSELAMLKKHITAFWILPSLPPKGAFVTFKIALDAHGALVSFKKIASSGNTALDISAQHALESASPFPMPKDPSLSKEFREIELTLKPG